MIEVGASVSVVRGVQIACYWFWRGYWYKARLRLRTRPFRLIRQFTSIPEAEAWKG